MIFIHNKINKTLAKNMFLLKKNKKYISSKYVLGNKFYYVVAPSIAVKTVFS